MLQHDQKEIELLSLPHKMMAVNVNKLPKRYNNFIFGRNRTNEEMHLHQFSSVLKVASIKILLAREYELNDKNIELILRSAKPDLSLDETKPLKAYENELKDSYIAIRQKRAEHNQKGKQTFPLYFQDDTPFYVTFDEKLIPEMTIKAFKEEIIRQCPMLINAKNYIDINCNRSAPRY